MGQRPVFMKGIVFMKKKANVRDLVELVMAMEEEFDMGEANEDELAGLKTVGDAVNFVASKLK